MRVQVGINYKALDQSDNTHLFLINKNEFNNVIINYNACPGRNKLQGAGSKRQYTHCRTWQETPAVPAKKLHRYFPGKAIFPSIPLYNDNIPLYNENTCPKKKNWRGVRG
jgi:hypothetical protein